MANEIIWSPLSVETYDEILNYLLDKFGEQAVIKFVNIVDRKLKMIKPGQKCLGQQKLIQILTLPAYTKELR